ncbi:MAG: transcriptional regulator [Boseongicola sp.]|nr:MAG: transcriptional regulator [Boseongicola sp.]
MDEHDLIAQLESVLSEGTRKFRGIAASVLNDPEAFIRGSNSETCERLDASEPTLIRFCQAFGYRGTSEFRIDLALAHARDRRGLSAVEPLHQDRRLVNVAQKMAIADAAAQRVSSDRHLLIDSGSTAEIFARALCNSPGKTIMTASLMVAQILMDQGQHDVLLTGGRIRSEARSLTGQLIPQSLSEFHFDTFVMGADCADPGSGLSTFDEDEAVVTRALMGSARRVNGLMDQSKFGEARLHKVCKFDALDCLITDLAETSQITSELRQSGANVVLVKPALSASQ